MHFTTLLILKLTLAPCMVLLAHYLQKNYGHGMGGRLIGLPITTGPFILIICLQEGRSFGAHVTRGVLLGQIALTMYCWVYAMASSKFNWWISLFIGTATVLTTGFLTTQYEISVFQTLLLLGFVWIVAMKNWPEQIAQNKKITPPSWELPARVLVTVSVLFILAALAPHLGANLSGALSTYPVIASVLSAFNHRRYGPASTLATLRGLMETLPLTIAFIATLAFTL
jgi:hypothetical protein